MRSDGPTAHSGHQSTRVRIAKPSYGALNPQRQPFGVVDRSVWGRYDVPGHHTVYASTVAQAAYAECAASLRPALMLDAPLSDFFDLEAGDDPDQTVGDVVQQEWENDFHWDTHNVAARWRHDRRLYSLALPADGWFVHVEHADSIAVVNDALGPHIAGLASGHRPAFAQLTTEALRGEDRHVSTTIAEWIHQQTLDDGNRPHGVYYGSKLGADWGCWAIWLRVIDDDGDPANEPTTITQTQEIREPEHNLDLKRVGERFHLCFL